MGKVTFKGFQKSPPADQLQTSLLTGANLRSSTPSTKENPMGKTIWESPAGPDDPIYKEKLTIYTPRSARGSTPKTPDKGSGRASKAKGAASKPTSTKKT